MIKEAAGVLGCHPNTIANWLRRGLKPIDKVRPDLDPWDGIAPLSSRAPSAAEVALPSG